MLKVYKYEIPTADEFGLALPIGAVVLSVQVQKAKPCMWCLVDPDQKKMNTRMFRFAGTEHPISCSNGDLIFIDTFQMDGGNLVFHLFEILK